MARERDDEGGEKFKRQIKSRQGGCERGTGRWRWSLAAREEAEKPDEKDERRGSDSEDEVHEQDAFELRAIKSPLPGKKSRGDDGKREEGGAAEIAVGGGRKLLAPESERQEIEGHAGKEQRDREVNQDDVLGVALGEGIVYREGMHGGVT